MHISATDPAQGVGDEQVSICDQCQILEHLLFYLGFSEGLFNLETHMSHIVGVQSPGVFM